MNSCSGPHPTADSLAILARRVQGLIDADLLLAQEGEALLVMLQAARQSLEAGDQESAHERIQQFVQALEALAQRYLRAGADGRAILDVLGQVLDTGVQHPIKGDPR